MIHGIGTDIVEVARIRRALERYGERFARRILAEPERAAFVLASNKAAWLAKRFAAKEAGVKAMGTGFRDGISLHQLYVSTDELGRPWLEFSGRAKQLTEAWNISQAHLSLADEREYAVAYVMLVKGSA